MRTLFVLALLSSVANAETRLSLAEAQAEARAHAPAAGELEARLRGAQAIARAARRVVTTNPVLSASIVPGTVAGHPDELSWDVGVQQQFDLSGSSSTRGAAAAADEDRVRFDRDDGLRALDEAVAVAVADLAFAEVRIVRTTRTAQLYALSAEAARKQLQVGDGNQIDTDVAELDLASAQADAAQAKGSHGAAQAALCRLLGRNRHADLAVDQGQPSAAVPAAPDLGDLVDRDPRVRAAQAEVRAARLQRKTYERMIWPPLTLGVSYGYRRRDIPEGSFMGQTANGLSARWTDTEVGFSLGLPLPVFDLKQPERAQATSRLLSAETTLAAVRADVRERLATAWTLLVATAEAYERLAATPKIIDREFDLLDKAMRIGALDAVSRALAVRRLQEAALRLDGVTHDLRVRRAQWTRTTAGLL